jgi:hypothetical protein
MQGECVPAGTRTHPSLSARSTSWRFKHSAAYDRAIANGRDESVTKLLFDDSPAPDAWREHRHGRGDCTWQLHGRTAGAQVSPQYPS